MGGKYNFPESTKRRSVLQFATIAGGFKLLSQGAAARSNQSRRAAPDGEGTTLGDFESGLDGWRTTGRNELEQVENDDVPAGVVRGAHALSVSVNGDMYPMIENKKRVKGADFLENPYLQVHVLARVEETDSDIVFQFRLRHTQSGGNRSGKSDSKSQRRKSVTVVESDRQTVPQLTPRWLEWDMTDLPDQALKTANRLEIVWYVEDHEPSGNHRGRNEGDFEYHGQVVFDDVRIMESPPRTESQRERDAKRDLHREHGMIVKRTFEERTATSERGVFVFSDGTEVPYEYEILDNGKSRYTLDGETFEYEEVHQE